MNIITVAIGAHYETVSKRLLNSLGRFVYVIDVNHSQYTQISNDHLINALYHKCNFANLIEVEDPSIPILFCDADMFALQDNPLETFDVPSGTDVAYVPYKGKWHLPDSTRQNAFDYHGHKINSGFLWFKDLSTAQAVSSQWAHEYLEREKIYNVEQGTSKYEYDEWALMIALQKMSLNIHLLNSKWNKWTLSTLEEMQASDGVFFQSHEHFNL